LSAPNTVSDSKAPLRHRCSIEYGVLKHQRSEACNQLGFEIVNEKATIYATYFSVWEKIWLDVYQGLTKQRTF